MQADNTKLRLEFCLAKANLVSFDLVALRTRHHLLVVAERYARKHSTVTAGSTLPCLFQLLARQRENRAK
jgi:hypothetical protein